MYEVTVADVINLVVPKIQGSTITDITDYGDAFAISYVNNKYYRSGRIEDLQIGCGPIIYIKCTGEIFKTASGQPTQNYIESYRRCGSIYGHPANKIQIVALPISIDKNRAILKLKQAVDLSISESKTHIEMVLHEGRTIIYFEDEYETDEAEDKLVALGFEIDRLWERIVYIET